MTTTAPAAPSTVDGTGPAVATDILLAARGVEITAAASGAQPSVRITAYTGGVMNVPGWGPLAIDLAGLDAAGQVRILADHDASIDGIVGHGRAEVANHQLVVTGAVAASGSTAQRVVQLAKDGFEFQASVGVEPSRVQQVKAGEKVQINGRTLVASGQGFTLVQAGKLREVSIVALGADERTAVAIAASRRAASPDEDRIRKEEWLRWSQIQATCSGDWGRSAAKVEVLKAQAIAGTITLEDLQEELLTLLRASRPQAPSVRTGWSSAGVPTATAIEAGLLLRIGAREVAEKKLGAAACEAGVMMAGGHLLDLCKASLQADGMDAPSNRMELVKAALSSMSLPVALGNVANKLLVQAYEEAPATWTSFAAVRSVPDFKEATAIRPSFATPLEQVAPGGEIKHGSIREAFTNYRVDTFGKMLAIDRRDLINDDLGVFDDTARALGRSAKRKLSDLVYETLLGGPGSFFSAARGNWLQGVDTTLNVDSLSRAITCMQSQRDEEGNDLDIQPTTLLVPPALAVTAKEVLTSEFIQRQTDRPTGNALRQAVSLAVEPRLANSEKFKTKASNSHWFLFASPADSALIVAFLNGQSAPTVEFFGLDQTVEALRVSWRVFHDFGSALCDPRAAVMSAGK